MTDNYNSYDATIQRVGIDSGYTSPQESLLGGGQTFDNRSLISGTTEQTIQTSLPLINDMDSLNADEEVQPYRQMSSLYETAATIWSSVLNMCNTILGMGTLGLAYAIRYSGFYPSIALLVFFGFMSWCGFYFMFSAAQQARKRGIKAAGYEVVATEFIPQMGVVVDCTVVIHCYGACIAYLIIIGDLMPKVANFVLEHVNSKHTDILRHREFWIILFTVVLIVPFVNPRKLHSFRYLSVIVMACFVYIIVLLGVEYLKAIGWIGSDTFLHRQHESIHTDAMPTRIIDFLRVLPIYVAAFCGHPNAFTVSNELERPSMTRLNIVIFITLALCTIIYALAGYAAYFTYGDAVESDVLLNCPHTTPVTIVRVALSISLCCMYPVQLFPARESISSLLYKKPARKMTSLQFYGITYVMVIISLGVALAVNDFSVVLIFLSSVGCVGLDYCVPAVFGFFSSESKKERICAVIFFCVAVFIMVSGVICEAMSGDL